jgi:hypothetical protein
VDDPAERNVMYERVIREASRIDDLRTHLNGAVLSDVWQSLFLRVRARRIGEERFPDLASPRNRRRTPRAPKANAQDPARQTLPAALRPCMIGSTIGAVFGRGKHGHFPDCDFAVPFV